MSEVYKTRSGDTWDMIAKEVYGDELYASLLMANNQELLEYFIFPDGVLVSLPEVPEEESLLPDWRS